MNQITKHLYFNTTKPNGDNLKQLYFSMGCFWGKESFFWQQKGVVFTEVGYANCLVDNPSCEDVFKDNISHREVVEITYNPSIISIENLLKLFFNNHTYEIRKDFPIPELYRSAIYLTNHKDLKITSIEKELIMRKFTNPIYTEVSIIRNYKKANEHHQQYVLKNPTI
jgi:peptide-methionine (S)-S-oxide reductase